MIAFLAALERELAELKKGVDVRASLKLGIATVAEGSVGGQQVLLVATGIGRKRAIQAAEDLLQAYPPEAVVSLGYGGALDASLQAGDLVISRRIYLDDTPGAHLAESHASLLAMATEAARGSGVRFIDGDGVTVPRVIDSEAAKRKIAEHLPATVVDMESYWVAQAATAKGIPFLGVRAISDSLDDALPDFAKIVDADGNLKPLSAGMHLSAHPDEAARLLKFARNAALAGRALGRFGLAFTSVYAQASSLGGAKA